MTREIPLTKGQIALVDDEDYDFLMQWKWFYNNGGYAVRADRSTGKYATVYMHRVVTGATSSQIVDHINRNKLDNQRSNLRFATVRINNQNRPADRDSTSPFKGVHWYARDGKWHAQIRAYGRTTHLGYFDNPTDAARAYDERAREIYGPNCFLNFPDNEVIA